MSEPLVLIPVNRLERAKGRLAGVIDARRRRELALATLRTVLAAAADAGYPATVLTADPHVVLEAEEAEAGALPEVAGATGLNGQLEAAIARLDIPPGGLLILHADLPLATGDALQELVAAAPAAPSVTLVRSSDGGTNAMLLRPPGRFALAYGPGSFEHHLAAARAAGLATARATIPALQLDLDTAEDLAAFRAHPAAPGTPAWIALGS
ncbi:MAG: 2-phospho-L-lactate guanylyltransferase [Dehalococcoidia bacterium]|nr:2-phospho-L-lactate guanylyltransferase [Dehalococcoidia bacterium]